MSEPRTACRHLALHALRNEEHDITLWGCDECQRRFYPACEQCVTIGHREGHGEHIEAAALPAAPAGLDVEKVARAIEKAGYGEITGDLDQYQEWGGSPREIAAKIAAAYAEEEQE